MIGACIIVSIWCPLPLVLKVVKLARELDGREDMWRPVETRPNRHPLRFIFTDQGKSDTFYDGMSKMISQWERENEPEEEEL